MDCVEVCPVDCFYEGENMLVIHPDECIDCGGDERNARSTRSSPIPSPALRWLSQRRIAKSWPNITAKKEPPADAKEWEGVANKFDEHFSSNPRFGD